MQQRISKVFVANRGEIAVRIVRAARELGMQTVLGCSAADVDSLAARMADEVVTVGPAPAAKSYLDISAVVAAAKGAGADAVHPGYGFLSENAEFAQAVVDAGLIFVGPSPRAITLMGDKAQARACAMKAGVPTVPGSEGVVENLAAALVNADQVGYPVMLKAAAGGGGRGIRVATDAKELEAQYTIATREAQSAFGYGGLYLERFVGLARHVEVQILADGERAIHLFERECSLQRRRQKLVEEAPSPSLDSEVRQRMCLSAVALAESVGYRGVGTVEYLYDPKTSEFFFIEMNTRVQRWLRVSILCGSPCGLPRENPCNTTRRKSCYVVPRLNVASMRKTHKKTLCPRQVQLMHCSYRPDLEYVSTHIYTKATRSPHTTTHFLPRSSSGTAPDPKQLNA
jgi:acetyl-CoA carboxylase biotin carboxylase subunit